jgi:tetratricopeptide (TPR) repeat protein
VATERGAQPMENKFARHAAWILGVALTAAWPSLGLTPVLASSASSAASSTGKSSASSAVRGGIASPEKPSQPISVLIAKLGDSHYAVRQSAQEELGKLGADAFDALVAAEDNDDLEIAARARFLVHCIRIDWIHETDSPQVKQALTDYDAKSLHDRLEVLLQLAQMPRSEALEPLCRLIRFERSPILAKEGALRIMVQPDSADSSWQQQSRQILRALANSDRAPARWLRNYVRAHDDPRGAIAEWSKLVAEELAISNSSDQPGEMGIQSSLMQNYAELLIANQRRAEAIAVMRKVISRVNDNVDSLVSFVDWLVEQKAWEVVDETARQFDRTFAADRTLLYAQAQSFKERGDAAQAEKYALQAFKIVSTDQDDLTARFTVAQRLWMHGMTAWSEREYRRIVDSDPPESEQVLKGRNLLADMFHDQGRDAEAAAMLGRLVDQFEKNGELASKIIGEFDMRPGLLRAQLHYYRACQAHENKDRKREVAELDEAIEKGDPADPDPDVIIALYRLPNQTPQRHQQTLDLIHKAAQSYETNLAAQSDPNNARIVYNEYAWLISNTEGDFDRALDYAKKSVELSSGDGEVLDTLGHCYAARKDYDNAVKCQEKAVLLDPGSMQIRHALNDFRRAREQAKGRKRQATFQQGNPAEISHSA